MTVAGSARHAPVHSGIAKSWSWRLYIYVKARSMKPAVLLSAL
jgi:hypothetical protein